MKSSTQVQERTFTEVWGSFACVLPSKSGQSLKKGEDVKQELTRACWDCKKKKKDNKRQKKFVLD